MNRRLAAALVALLPAAAPAQETPTPTPTPGGKPALSRPEPRDQKDFTTTGGGSLADIVRRAQEQREREAQTTKRSLGVITNENLKSGDEKTAAGRPQKSPTATPRGGAKAAGITPIPEFRDMKGRTESDWKGIMNDAQARITRTNARIRQLENETKKLENDFYAWSDGNYRERVIKPAWDKALTDLKKTREEADAARQAISDLEDDARKSGAQPGWLR